MCLMLVWNGSKLWIVKEIEPNPYMWIILLFHIYNVVCVRVEADIILVPIHPHSLIQTLH